LYTPPESMVFPLTTHVSMNIVLKPARLVLPLLLLLPAAASVAADDDRNLTTYSGYLVDLYCYGLGLAGTLALDGADVIRHPEEHTLHCLRDPSVCYESGYMLSAFETVGGSKEYHAKFLLDDAGNDLALQLLRSFPKGHKRDHQGHFRVTAIGYHNGDGTLETISVDLCTDAVEDCDSICNGDCDTPKLTPKLTVGRFLLAHMLCMVLSWGFLLPLGVIWAHGARNYTRTCCGSPVWFQGHRIVQSLGWLLQLLGFICILIHKSTGGARHFSSGHEVVGLIVVILGTLQPLNAQLRHLPFVGHGEPKTPYRRYWEWLHKGCGYSAVIGGFINILLGIIKASRANFGGAFVPLATGLGGSFFALALLGAFWATKAHSKIAECLRPSKSEVQPTSWK